MIIYCLNFHALDGVDSGNCVGLYVVGLYALFYVGKEKTE